MQLPTSSSVMNPIAYHGMVTSPHYLATQAGIDILRKRGTALDAAIAIGATLAVVYPHMCTLGGDAFWLVYDAARDTLRGINASGRAGGLATISRYREAGLTTIPFKGYPAANTVPGLVSCLAAAYDYSKKELKSGLSRAELLDAALANALDGTPASTSFVRTSRLALQKHVEHPVRYPLSEEFGRIFFPFGKPFREGQRLRQPDLAATLETLISEGFESFYSGTIADRIALDSEKNNGLLRKADFERHRADWVTPLHVPYRDCVAYNMPPNSQGMASLEILNILNNFDVFSLNAPLYCHVIVEATKEAFADRDRYLTDPAFSSIPTDELLSASHGREQAARISLTQASVFPHRTDDNGDTVWYGVVDDQGNAVSCIQSVYHEFGSGVVAKGTGIVLQNRGSYFSLDPTHVNCLAPEKRTFHTLNPAMLFRNGRPYVVYGTMGGEGQPQTQAAILTRVLDLGMTPNEAIYAPRWLFGRALGDPSNTLKLESRVEKAVCDELARLGHSVEEVSAFDDLMGHAGMIRIESRIEDEKETRTLYGASDPRGDGLAAGY